MNINFQCPINELSYGIASVNILKEVDKLGHRISVFPIGPIQCSQADVPLIQKWIDNSEMFDANAPCVRIYHQNRMAERIGRGKFYGFPIFELDTFSEIELNHLSSTDELIVCSEWAKTVVSVNLPNYADKVHVVPLGVDSKIFSPAPIVRGTTVFVNIGKWEKRKGHDILARAFLAAFPKDEDVRLFMLPTNPFAKDEEKSIWEARYKNPKIVLRSRLTAASEVARMLQEADCGVFPSRAEGWNLGAIETLACGKHLIITDYSAHTQFCNEENARLIKVDAVEPAIDGIWFFGAGNWASLGNDQFEQLVNHFQAVHREKQAGTLKINQSGVNTANEYSWCNSARKLMGVLNDKG